MAKKQQKVQAMQAVLNAVSIDGDLTAAEQATFDALKADVSSINAGIEQQQQADAAVMVLPVSADSIVPGGGQSHIEHRIPQRNPGTARGRAFREMFAGLPLDSGGFRSSGEFFAVIHSGQWHPNLMAAAGMSESVGADGGFLVPTEYVSRMLDMSLESEVVRPRARIEPMSSSSKVISGFDASNHSTHIGGFTGQWVGEGQTMSPQKGLIRTFNLVTAKLVILAAATNELLADGASFEQLLEATLAGALGFHLDDAFLNGDGVGKPRGVLKDPALITVAKETGQAADTVGYMNLTRMLARMHSGCFRNSVWVVHPSTLSMLYSVTIPVFNPKFL